MANIYVHISNGKHTSSGTRRKYGNDISWNVCGRVMLFPYLLFEGGDTGLAGS